MFVVQVSRDEMPFDMKVFDELADAAALAKGYAQGGDDAKVYRVAHAENAQAAVAAVETGCGELMVTPARRRSVAEKAHADRQAWRKLLDDLVAVTSGRLEY